ncbi:hypothetical protein GPICK_15765 [Geobacter pickeringii]|uniref:DUF1990 domain-containing protein n=2 Tax=Geobacter pickeringii TaxID=345632 RepID=A0A0B5BE18_9BACT|nr:hypothetical protein GPICK_15765 [Geobacter pickeringii]
MPRDDAMLPREIACQQILLEDSSVFSIQWTTLPGRLAAGVTPAWLLERYLAYIRGFTCTLIRPRRTGERVEFCLAGTARSLISFTAPRGSREASQESLSLGICGGILVQSGQRRRGELAFTVAADEESVRLTLCLSGYCPLILGSATPSPLRKTLYRVTQATLHKVVTIRFLAHIHRELAGRGGAVKVVPARVREGEEI